MKDRKPSRIPNDEEVHCTDTMNKEQAEKLYKEEAILLGFYDVVPVDRVRELFGERVVMGVQQFIEDSVKGSSARLADYIVKLNGITGYLDSSFYLAVSLYNAALLNAQRDKAYLAQRELEKQERDRKHAERAAKKAANKIQGVVENVTT